MAGLVRMKDSVKVRATGELATLGELADAGRVAFLHKPGAAMALDRYRAYVDPPRNADGSLAENWQYEPFFPIGKLAYQSRMGEAIEV